MDVDDDDLFPAEPTAFERIEQARQRAEPRPLTLPRCQVCDGPAVSNSSNPEVYAHYRASLDCPGCDGIGFVNVPTSRDVLRCTRAGSPERIAVYAARYRAGLSIFHDAAVESIKWA